jgi:hypothetical protein
LFSCPVLSSGGFGEGQVIARFHLFCSVGSHFL